MNADSKLGRQVLVVKPSAEILRDFPELRLYVFNQNPGVVLKLYRQVYSQRVNALSMINNFSL